ncbi:MAG TPA: glycine cleavage system aminomethyltransferase GcvT [Clostridiales bacterium]|mgnify:CR=1 FL=1|jgi:aminomethyltransferase|nr:glycine cleavage system aminomethyltransferase GcvT [Clostridiales bacterium]
MSELKTPLYEAHMALGGKIVPFAGYLMPVQYPAGVIAEHMAVREKAGLFDVSHMGEILFKGPDATANLQTLLTNDFSSMPLNKARYSVMCNEEGGCVDDLIVYKYSDEAYFIVVNAANKDKDFAWMQSHCFGKATCTDISDTVGLLALQGPAARTILSKVTDAAMLPTSYFTANFHGEIEGKTCMISRTGYTGESGYELYLAAEDTVAIWNLLLEAGKEEGLIPCGLGARDTLRLEAAMPLYGHEMDDTISPLEAGLDFAVKLQKAEFIGKKGILAKGKHRTRVGLKVTGKGIIREHMDLYADNILVGHTTSGTFAPYLNHPLGMALVDVAYSEPGTGMEADVRGRRVACQVVSLPFYKTSNK